MIIEISYSTGFVIFIIVYIHTFICIIWDNMVFTQNKLKFDCSRSVLSVIMTINRIIPGYKRRLSTLCVRFRVYSTLLA